MKIARVTQQEIGHVTWQALHSERNCHMLNKADNAIIWRHLNWSACYLLLELSRYRPRTIFIVQKLPTAMWWTGWKNVSVRGITYHAWKRYFFIYYPFCLKKITRHCWKIMHYQNFVLNGKNNNLYGNLCRNT